MKAAILAGGKGSRLMEETRDKPKALVEIGGEPIVRHIMGHYSRYGIHEFVIALGHHAGVLQDYFHLHPSANVTLVDTGVDTATGGRVKRLQPYLGNETFMLTWCDGVSDVDFHRLLAFHRRHGKLVTVTAVHPPARFGILKLRGDYVEEFREKPAARDEWINGAFFVVEPRALDYIDGDQTPWEGEPMERLAREGELVAYRHEGFWQCMDTIHEKAQLEEMLRSGHAPWRLTQ